MKKNCLLSTLVLLVMATVGHGGLIAPQSLLSLNQNADLIVVGTASGISQEGPATSFSLQVSRVLKGDSGLSGTAISVLWKAEYPGAAVAGAVVGGGSGIWYLQRSSSAWDLLPVVQGNVSLDVAYFPTAPGPVLGPYAYAPAAALGDKVAAEIGSAIESVGGSLSRQLNLLQYGPLDQLNSPYTSLLYQRLSTSLSLAQQIIGLSGLIRAGSGASLSSAVKEQAGFVSSPTENSILLLSIRDFFRAPDSASVATLGQAVVDQTNPNTPFREAAAHALAAIHTVATLPYLADLLGDQDLSLRVEAVGGMGAFANGLPVQTPAGVASLAYLRFPASAPYMTVATRANFALGRQTVERNEAAYLSFWRQWWLDNKTSLGF